MYAIVTDNEITKFINHPKSLVIGDVRYPAKIFSVWSASELNNIGIYSFDQVSKMTEKEYDLLDSLLDSFQGRAKRDDWAGQAKNLKNNG